MTTVNTSPLGFSFPRLAEASSAPTLLSQPLSLPVENAPETVTLDITSRIEMAHHITSHDKSPRLVMFPDALQNESEVGSEALLSSAADSPLSPDWSGLASEVAGEAARISKIRAGFKGQVNQDRMASLQAALALPEESDKITALATALKKAGFGSDSVIGAPPTAQGVASGIQKYLDSVRNDYHLRPRSWH